MLDERGAVLLDALAEWGDGNGLAAGREASDQSRSERRYNKARLHRLSPFVLSFVGGDFL
jgi:hypothetical protein